MQNAAPPSTSFPQSWTQSSLFVARAAMLLSPVLVSSLLLSSVFVSCAPSRSTPATPASTEQKTLPSTAPSAVTPVADDARGGRLFDNFRAEKDLGDGFVPDRAATPELDGRGGPNGNGTLNDGAGRPMPNTGHDYRLKNLFGWDLRGAQGLYGPEFHAKPFVLQRNLLNDTRSAEELEAWLEKGDAQTPAYGALLDSKDLDDLVAFLVKTANSELARPEGVFELDTVAPKGYRLLAGADVTRGHQRYASACAECHGSNGTKIKIDETLSAGSISRTSGYEIWFKLQHGHPGSSMKRQVSEATGAANSQGVLELLAALCDRAKYPALSGQEDVPDGDARCGAYLK